MAEPRDDDLIQAIARRDPTALTALYDRYRRLAFALAYRIVDDAAAAEEVVQDAFLLVWQQAASFNVARTGSARAWLLTIVRHRAIDLRRRLVGRRREILGLDDTVTMAVPDGHDDVTFGLDRRQIQAAVAALPEEQRRAIELAYFEGLTHREIAARTGAPLGTVKGRLRLGLRKLHGSLVAARAERGEVQAEECDGATAATPAAAGRERGGSDATQGR